MFNHGLHNIVDIYFMNHEFLGNRRDNLNIQLSDEPDLKDINCRINEKEDTTIMFDGDFDLKDGAAIKDKITGRTYEVLPYERYKATGIADIHHSTYKIKLKKESELNDIY